MSSLLLTFTEPLLLLNIFTIYMRPSIYVNRDGTWFVFAQNFSGLKLTALTTAPHLTIHCLFPPTYLIWPLFWLCNFFCLFCFLMSYIINSVLYFLKIGRMNMWFRFPVKYFNGHQCSVLLLTDRKIIFVDLDPDFANFFQIVHEHFL